MKRIALLLAIGAARRGRAAGAGRPDHPRRHRLYRLGRAVRRRRRGFRRPHPRGRAGGSPIAAARVVDARGMIVAPGFIDPHAHLGEQLAAEDARTRLIPAFLMQGVTTALIGNDGGGDPDVGGGARQRPAPAGRDQLCRLCRLRRGAPGGDRRGGPRADARRADADAADGRGGDVPGRARPFDRPVLRAAKLRHDRRGRRAGPRGGRARRRLRQPYPRRIELLDRPRRGGGRSDRDRPRRRGCRSTSPTSRRSASTSTARRRRSSRGSRRRAGPGSGSPPINIPGRLRARASPPRWCRAGRRTAGGPPCCAASTIRRVAARLRADMAENLRRRGGAESLLITEGQYRGQRLAAGCPHAGRRSGRCGDRGHPGRRSARRLVQPDRGGHRRLHAPAVGDDQLRRLRRASARLWQLRAQICGICAPAECAEPARLHRAQHGAPGRHVPAHRSRPAAARRLRRHRRLRSRSLCRARDL